MSRRLKQIEKSIAQLSQRIDLLFRELHERELRKILATIMHLFERSDIARTLPDWRKELIDISNELGNQSYLLRYEISHLLTADTYDDDLFNLLLRPMLASDTTRVELLLEVNQFESAHKAAETIGANYSQLFDHMSARQLLKQLENSRYFELSDTSKSRSALNLKMQGISTGLRDITDMALTRPLTIESMDKHGLIGIDYYRWLREEKEEPFLLLAEP